MLIPNELLEWNSMVKEWITLIPINKYGHISSDFINFNSSTLSFFVHDCVLTILYDPDNFSGIHSRNFCIMIDKYKDNFKDKRECDTFQETIPILEEFIKKYFKYY